MKGRRSLEPTKDLLDKVILIADAKAQPPISERAHLNDWGVYCRVNRLPGGALLYHAGGKFIARLRFVVEVNGSITVRKYRPGDWEKNLALTYDNARFRAENLREAKEMDELLADARDTEEKIRRLEQRASEVPNQPNYWSTTSILMGLYLDQGRFRDAENAAITGVEAWPTQPITHFTLSYIYFIAVLNAKRAKVGEANEQFIREYGARAVGLTPEALGYTYEQAYALAERHIEKTLESSPKKDKGTLRKRLSALKAIDRIPGLKAFEEAINKNPDSAAAWLGLSWKYVEVGNFKAAEKAASTGVSLAPDVAQLHFALSTIYYGALGNSKGIISPNAFSKLVGVDRAEQSRYKEAYFILSEQPLNGLTLEVLECNDEYARQMVETHAMETIKLSKDKRLRRAAKEQLANVRMLDHM